MKAVSVLCLRCATVFSAASSVKVFTCPNCAWSIEATEFQQLYAEANRIIRYGHMYREVYEEQYESDGEVSSMYCLVEPPPWYVFAGIAAISGVIGNASYDVVKHVVKRLYAQCRQADDRGRSSLRTEEGVEILVRHTRQYVHGMSEVNVVVRQCIEEEERADLVSKENSEILARTDKAITPKMAGEAAAEALRTVMRRIKSGETSCIDRSRMQRLLSEVWNELPDESAHTDSL